MSNLTIIYLGGYGRSGSTVLGTLLGAAPDVVHAGELSFLAAEWRDPHRFCSCGLVLRECPVWRHVDPDHLLAPDEWRDVRKAEALPAVPRLLSGGLSRRSREAVRAYESRVLSAIATGAGAHTIVDSSKTARAAAGRPLALARYGEARVILVHITRDGRRCVQSLLSTGSNWKLEGRTGAVQPGALRACLGWLTANLTASISGRLFFKDRYCRIRFEDLLADPEAALGDLERRIGLDLAAVRHRVKANDSFEVGHVVGGNRLRFEKEVRLQTTRDQSPLKLSRYQRLVFWLTAGWLNRVYGYGR